MNSQSSLLNAKWPNCKLAEAFDFANGINFSASQKGRGIPTVDVLNMYPEGLAVDTSRLYRVDVDVAEHRLLKPNDILFVRSSVKRSGIAWPAIFAGAEEPTTYCGFLIRGRPKGTHLDSRFFIYYLRQPAVRQEVIARSGTSALTNINQQRLGSLPVPLPPLSEQKRIADILDKADAIRRKRQETIKTSSHLIESGFSHFFGDTLLNPRGFHTGTLEELAGTIVDCPHSTPTYANGETEYFCVRSSDIQDGNIDLTETRYVTESTYVERIARHKPRSGEVVYTREGGRLGNAAQLPPNKSVCLGQRMMLFGAKPDVSTTEFIWALLNSPGLRHQVNSLIGGAAAPRINIADIRKFQVTLPPYELQVAFSAFVEKIREQAVDVDKSRRELGDLFNSLVQRAFKGEL